jgi:predicted ArsR family transcriptional regulator
MGVNEVLSTQMPATRRRILIALKERGGMTADELAEQLNITSVAVRRHLANLERDRLVDHEEIQHRLGRPSYGYRLTEAAASLFPSNYDQLASYVLEAVEGLFGREAVDRIFEQRRQELARSYRPLVDGDTLPDRLEQLTHLRQAEGYMLAWEAQPDGSYELRQYHCPIQRVAEGCQAACVNELALYVDLLDAEVTRQSHQAAGDTTCSYQIRPRQ